MCCRGRGPGCCDPWCQVRWPGTRLLLLRRCDCDPALRITPPRCPVSPHRPPLPTTLTISILPLVAPHPPLPLPTPGWVCQAAAERDHDLHCCPSIDMKMKVFPGTAQAHQTNLPMLLPFSQLRLELKVKGIFLKCIFCHMYRWGLLLDNF